MNEIVKANSGFETASYVISQVEPLARMADLYAKGGLVPTALIGNSAAVFTILTAGVELGIGPATALRAIHIIEGRATLSAGIMVGLAMMAGVAFEYQQQDATACRIKWTRGESSGVVTFTMADAKLAGLADRPNWKKYPAAMLTARCQSMAARQSAPDRLAGLYAPEELGAPVTVRESGDVEVIETTTPEPPPPVPFPLNRQEWAAVQAELVTLEGVLLTSQEGRTEAILKFQNESLIFEALLPIDEARGLRLTAGDRLRLSGIFRMQMFAPEVVHGHGIVLV